MTLAIPARSLYQLDDIKAQVESGTITAAVTADGTKHRLFVSSAGNLCRFADRSSRRGWILNPRDVEKYVKLIPKKTLTEEEKLKQRYRGIAKYRRMASEASFTNNFIRDCLDLPATFEAYLADKREPGSWRADESPYKCLYDYHVTTGTAIDGKVISLDRIAKQYPRQIERLRDEIKNRTVGGEVSIIAGRYLKFAGYDISLSCRSFEDGDFQCWLSLEYAGCLNGYYYLLINDNNFIGYDID